MRAPAPSRPCPAYAWVLCCLLAGLLGGCGRAGTTAADGPALERQADAVVRALQERDWEALAGVVHPARGVRFSPYAYVDTAEHVVLSAAAVRRLGADEKVYKWGYEDGTGAPIELRPAAYVARYVYDKDFAAARPGAPGEVLGSGNTVNNLGAAYGEPGTTFVEYHVPGAAAAEGMDWASLRLVFTPYDGAWRLIGIVHDQWTI